MGSGAKSEGKGVSALKETLIYCDGPPAVCPQEGPYGNGDGRELNASSQRTGYKTDGWHYWQGKDYCPTCWRARKAADK
jgi:hypothetical protein